MANRYCLVSNHPLRTFPPESNHLINHRTALNFHLSKAATSNTTMVAKQQSSWPVICLNRLEDCCCCYHCRVGYSSLSPVLYDDQSDGCFVMAVLRMCFVISPPWLLCAFHYFITTTPRLCDVFMISFYLRLGVCSGFCRLWKHSKATCGNRTKSRNVN